MEAFPVQFCRNIRMYWQRKRYQSLVEGSSPTRRTKSLRIVKLGGDDAWWSWKLRRRGSTRLRLICSPVKKLLARVRDTYINAMLGIIGKGGGVSGFVSPDAFWAKRVPKARPIRSKLTVDFETRLLLEIYKSFLTPGHELTAL